MPGSAEAVKKKRPSETQPEAVQGAITSELIAVSKEGHVLKPEQFAGVCYMSCNRHIFQGGIWHGS